MTSATRASPGARWRSALLALGGAYTALGVAWPFLGLTGDEPLQDGLIIAVLVGGAGLSLLYGSYRLPETDIRPEFFATIANWCFRAVAVMVAILVFIELATGLNDPASNFLILPALAAVAGFGAGQHDAKAKSRAYVLERRNEELQQTREELEQTVARLEESERRYRTVTENFPNGAVALLDTELRFTLVAGQGFEKVDFGAGDLRGERVRDVYSGEVLEVMEANYRATLDGEPTAFELAIQGRTFEFRTHPLTDDGDVYAILAMSQDITERKQHERRLQETVAKLEESNERLEQFAYAASHDLQEPLRMISSYLQLLENRYGDDLDADAEEFLDYAVDGADRMRAMIDGLLQYSRVETQGAPFEPVDLETVLADAREDLQVKIDEYDAEIAVDDLPRVEGDPDQLRQVFQNLLDNALEYSGDEPPRIHVSAERRDGRRAAGQRRADRSSADRRAPARADGRRGDPAVAEADGGQWIVSVSDEGIGMDPDRADGVFEVFERLHPPDEHPGTGIGLALCERIVERHGGEIWVDSSPGEGTTFSFTVPAVDDREP